MPKNILFESAIHQLAAAGGRRLAAMGAQGEDKETLRGFLRSLRFESEGPRTLRVYWSSNTAGSCTLDFSDAKLYRRGDTGRIAEEQGETGLTFCADSIACHNQECFDRWLNELLTAAAVTLHL